MFMIDKTYAMQLLINFFVVVEFINVLTSPNLLETVWNQSL